jgi:Spy/CpxP family protein refolding chaperone
MNRSALAAVTASFLLWALTVPTAAQPKDGARIEKKANVKETKGRLPAHFAKVVDDQQRERIYGIQAAYSERIDALRAQLERLEAQRDAEIRAVLTPAQRRQLEQLIVDAKAVKEGKAARKVGEANKAVGPAMKITAKKPG